MVDGLKMLRVEARSLATSVIDFEFTDRSFIKVSESIKNITDPVDLSLLLLPVGRDVDATVAVVS
jgi:hypothetical protein